MSITDELRSVKLMAALYSSRTTRAGILCVAKEICEFEEDLCLLL